MTSALPDRTLEPRPLRLWPGVVIVALQWLGWMAVPYFLPEAGLYAIMAGVFGGGLAIIVWWLFFSRAPWVERLGILVLLPAAMAATYQLAHKSIAGGAMGLWLVVYGIPVLCLALVGGAVVSRRLTPPWRRVAMVAAILLACSAFLVLRTGGMSGEGAADLHWRWTPTPEEELLALAGAEKTVPPASLPAAKIAAAWPGFRGPERNSVVPGAAITTDWTKAPPVLLWKRPVGPGWSSFAVRGDFFYTQEQRGEEEVVACYALKTGQPVWIHRDAARFWESNAGAGPRATPTLSEDHVYTLGATGIVNKLHAATGAVVWSRQAATDTGAKVPEWGFAGSPLLVDDLVIVATAGRLAAYERDTGKPRWTAQTGGEGYSSPHLATLHGVKQILLLNTSGLMSLAPETGKELWKYKWKGDGIVQPSLLPDGDLVLGAGSGLAEEKGICRVTVAPDQKGWAMTQRWNVSRFKPYFSDFVIHQGHVYGFDGSLLACIDLADGQRKWKGGRYGHGQLLLLPEPNLLLVLSEQGDLALVAAKPEQFQELAKGKGIEGKTWNHPVLVDDILLVRNAEEMAAFRLPRSN